MYHYSLMAFESAGYFSSSVPISSCPPSTRRMYLDCSSISGASPSNISFPPLMSRNAKIGVETSSKMVWPCQCKVNGGLYNYNVLPL